MAISAGQNLQPFTGNGDVSIRVKNFEWDDKLHTTNQPTDQSREEILHFYYITYMAMPQYKNLCPGVIRLKILIDPFLVIMTIL